jgi:hypothetical protein
MSSHDCHQVGSLRTEVPSSSAQDAQGLKSLNAGRSAGGPLYRSASRDRHSTFGRGDGRSFGDHRVWRARYGVPHRKVRSDTGIKAAAFLIPSDVPRRTRRGTGGNRQYQQIYYVITIGAHALILHRSLQASDSEMAPQAVESVRNRLGNGRRHRCLGETPSSPYPNAPVMSFIVGKSPKASNRPFSAMSFAARMNPPQAARASAPPTLIRLTPRSSS